MRGNNLPAAYVATVEAGRYVEALEEFYHAHATMQDNQKPPRIPF
jgi:hypothetical protein